MPSEKCKVFRQAFFGTFSAVSPYPMEDQICRSSHHHPNHHQCVQHDTDAALAERRSAHNALERQRREHLNHKYQELAHILPTLQNIHRPNKTLIITKSLDYVSAMINQQSKYKSKIEELQRLNESLRLQASSSMSQYLTFDDPSLFLSSTGCYASPPPSLSSMTISTATSTVSDNSSRLSLQQ